MTTALEIVTDALRETNLIAIGTTPTSAQQTEGLRHLRRLISGVYGHDVGENLRDWMVGTDGQNNADASWTETYWTYPFINSRVLLNHTSAQTIYLPKQPENGSRIQVIDVKGVLATYNVTLDGNGRLIEEAETLVLSINDTNSVWIYNADTSNWVLYEQLDIGDTMPFPVEFDDYFVVKLASRLSPRYGRALTNESLAQWQDVKGQLEARYRQTRNVSAPKAVLNTTDPNSQVSHFRNRSGRYGWMS